jgi:hypothetical protein
MFDEKTKTFLIKAMTDGIDCEFSDESEINEYIDKLKTTIEKNDRIESSLMGDHDGVLLEDKYGVAYAIIKFTRSLISFALLVPEPELDQQQTRDFGRTVLACISVFAENNAKNKMGSTKPKSTLDASKSFTFEISEIGIIV